MFLKQALTNFYRLNYASKSGWFIWARAYIYILQLALLITLVLSHFSDENSGKLWNRIFTNILVPLESTSVPLHTLVCSVIGMDKIYILHLISSGTFSSYRSCYLSYVSKHFDYAVFVSNILTMLAYWIFNFRTRILYL